MQQGFDGSLQAQQVALEAVKRLGPVIERIHRRDRSLSDQIRRAASSVVLNLAEASYNNAGHRRARLESARGSANEVRAALGLALAWGYIDEARAHDIDTHYDRVLAMTYRLWSRA
jgi:four helix bundle protein